MPRFRPEIEALTPYEVGRPVDDLARDVGLDASAIIRLTANESPDGPFPGVVDAVARAVARSNRYPDPDVWELGHALAEQLGVDRKNLLFGAGSVALLADIALSVGGPGTRSIYGWPSFVMYRFVTTWAMGEAAEVPLTDAFELDLDAMLDAVDDATRVVYLCNPNNPTGTLRSPDDIERFATSVPAHVLVVVDEAYHDFVTRDEYRTAIPLALEMDNVLVLRTFSKVYALAAHRIGYAVGRPETLTEIRKAQAPLTVNQVAQAAALASLGQPDELRRRVEANAAGRHHLVGVMAERGLDHAQSHTNFVFFKMPGSDSRAASDEFANRGVIIRPLSGGWMRVTVGAPAENERFVAVLDQVLDTVSE